MQLLYLLNGRAERIIKANSFDDTNIDILKIDEKELTDYKRIIDHVKKHNYKHFYFGCIEIDLQRFHFFMMLYIFLTTRSGGIVDESGKSLTFSFTSFLLKYLPMFILEISVSGFIVLYHYLKLPYDKMKWLKAK
jgi:hypothetical protein